MALAGAVLTGVVLAGAVLTGVVLAGMPFGHVPVGGCGLLGQPRSVGGGRGVGGVRKGPADRTPVLVERVERSVRRAVGCRPLGHSQSTPLGRRTGSTSGSAACGDAPCREFGVNVASIRALCGGSDRAILRTGEASAPIVGKTPQDGFGLEDARRRPAATAP
ncbi:hypothetical protein [Kitasatospora purpeofusca]|uniref:hypothetical protein n=1 Tax=Kitasatospora purpeofusca TaxID=67352 RepID=UPI0036D22274